MGDKYIIELEEKPFHDDNGDFLYRVKGFNSLVFDMTGINKLISYTEPDMEQVRKEEYDRGHENGYSIGYDEGREAGIQAGMCDAWEAARKVADYWMHCRSVELFNTPDIIKIFENKTASEAIEKLKVYEQEKDAEIKVGDEVENTQTGVKFIVTHLWENNRGEQGVSGFNQKCSAFSTTLSLVVKTGRHFPEIAEVLEKMRGSE